MRSQIEKLRMDFSNELGSVQGGETVEVFAAKLKIAERYIDFLKSMMAGYSFDTAAEAIDYYKNDAVFFYGAYFEFLKRCDLESKRFTLSPESFRRYSEQELADVDAFFTKHEGWVLYFLSGLTDKDYQVFSKNSGLVGFSEYAVTLDNSLCAGTRLLALCQVNLEYKRILSGEADVSVGGDVYEWACSDRDAGEIIKVFFDNKVIKVNGKDANVKQLAEFWKRYLGRPISNIYDVIRVSEKRKKDKKPFLRWLMGEGKVTEQKD